LERDVQAHAKTITEFTVAITELKTDAAIQEVKDGHTAERLTRIETSINNVYRLGWWVLAAFGGSFIALVANFIFKGGFYIGK
jgi:hypothetical protein